MVGDVSITVVAVDAYVEFLEYLQLPWRAEDACFEWGGKSWWRERRVDAVVLGSAAVTLRHVVRNATRSAAKCGGHSP